MNSNTVHSLRKAGHKVRVTHLRHGKIQGWSSGVGWYDEKLTTRTDILSKLDAEFYPRGGATCIDITMADGREVHGQALFGDDENYNRKEGVAVALSDAISDLRPLHPYAVYRIVPEAQPSRGVLDLDEEMMKEVLERAAQMVSERNKAQMSPEFYDKFILGFS